MTADHDAAYESHLLEASLAQQARSSLWPVAAAQIASQLISLGVLAALYRLLDPADFGLLAMALTWIVLLRSFGSLSLGVAIVQSQAVSQQELSALFWINLLVAATSTLLGAALAPCVAWFYGVAAVGAVTAALAGTILLSAFAVVHQAIVERRLQLARVAWMRVAAQAGGGAAAIGAAVGAGGVWALIVQQYVEWGLLGLLLWSAAGWRPGVPRSLTATRRFVRFGGQYTLSGLMNYLAGNFDKVLLGRLGAAGEAALGYYTQAFNLMLRPTYAVTTPLAALMLPVLARAAAAPADYRRLLLEFVRLIAWLLFPVAAGLLLTGRDVMLVIGGPQWAPAGEMLVALAPAVLVQGYFNVAASIFASAGRTDRLLRASIVAGLILCQGFVCGRLLGEWFGPPLWGPALGMAWSYSLTLLFVLAVPFLAYLLHTVGIRWREFLSVMRVPFTSTLVMAGVVLLVQRSLHDRAEIVPAARLAIEVTAGAAVYALLARSTIARWQRGEAL